VIVLIETGLRSVDARHLPFDPVTVDQAGAPYLRFRNHKRPAEADHPDQPAAAQTDTRPTRPSWERATGFTRRCCCRASARTRPERRAMDGHYVNLRIARWMNECGIRDATVGWCG